jgi:hypothetical protein
MAATVPMNYQANFGKLAVEPLAGHNKGFVTLN